MFVNRAAAVTVRTPAKLNLFFEVLGKRGDGFHEIETLMAPIGLYDVLHFEPHAGPAIELDCRWAEAQANGPDSPLGDLPPPDKNIATRALELLRARAGVSRGASVQLIKRIPCAAGLGGGSSDAAAALLAGNQGWEINLPLPNLMKLAAEIGSDVPFFLTGQAAICRGRGELIEPVRGLGCLHFVVVRPPQGLSTAKVYANCRVPTEPKPLGLLVSALRSGNLGQAGRLIHNQLEPAARELSPWIDRLRDEFARVDCVAARMSGSGSSYFGLCRNARHARRACARMQSRGVGRVFAVRSVSEDF